MATVSIRKPTQCTTTAFSIENSWKVGPQAVHNRHEANTQSYLMTLHRTPQSVDEYISSFAPEIQQILQEIRSTIHKAAPDTRETIRYGMPAFSQHGILVYFAAFKKHIGLYPPVSGNAALNKAIAPYAGPKGSLKFPLDQPIPYRLIEQITKLRVQQNKAKAAAKPPRKQTQS